MFPEVYEMTLFTVTVEPFGPKTFGKYRRATRLHYFIPVQVSLAPNWKLAAGWMEVSTASLVSTMSKDRSILKKLTIKKF